MYQLKILRLDLITKPEKTAVTTENPAHPQNCNVAYLRDGFSLKLYQAVKIQLNIKSIATILFVISTVFNSAVRIYVISY